MRFVEREIAFLQRVVLQTHLNCNVHRHDIAHLSVVFILQGVVRIQLELVQTESVRQ